MKIKLAAIAFAPFVVTSCANPAEYRFENQLTVFDNPALQQSEQSIASVEGYYGSENLSADQIRDTQKLNEAIRSRAEILNNPSSRDARMSDVFGTPAPR